MWKVLCAQISRWLTCTAGELLIMSQAQRLALSTQRVLKPARVSARVRARRARAQVRRLLAPARRLLVQAARAPALLRKAVVSRAVSPAVAMYRAAVWLLLAPVVAPVALAAVPVQFPAVLAAAAAVMHPAALTSRAASSAPAQHQAEVCLQMLSWLPLRVTLLHPLRAPPPRLHPNHLRFLPANRRRFRLL